VDAREYVLRLRARRPEQPYLFETHYLAVVYEKHTPLTLPSHIRRVSQFVRLFERTLRARAPELLPQCQASGTNAQILPKEAP
jgi:hypothetical protein